MNEFRHQHRVRYHETDAQKFAFNARYLEWADVVMAEFFRALGWSYPELLELGFDPSVVHSELDFAKPARLDDLLDITVSCPRVGRSSFDLSFVIASGNAEVTRINNTYVNVDIAEAAASAIPEVVAAALRACATETAATSAS
jgi:acyl-CoA thioester hydrolase